MTYLTQLIARRGEIVGKISEIKSMRKGVLNAKYQKVAHKNGEIAIKGPYYLLTKKGPGGKTISEAIPAKDAPRVQEEVDSYKRFRQLSDEYVEVCEKISLLTAKIDDNVKKN
jgi:hypothetical protein